MAIKNPRVHLSIVDPCPLEQEQFFDSPYAFCVCNALLRRDGRQYYVRDLAYMDGCYKIFLGRIEERENEKQSIIFIKKK